jgi:molybdopterin molybdotransferase
MSDQKNNAKLADNALRNASVADARARMLAETAPLARDERVPLAKAHGRILAERIVAKRDQPPFAASAMDGYAVRAEDTPGKLHVIGEAAAGGALGRALGKGETARIFTGAPMPEGSDTVVIQEDVTREGDHATVPQAPRADNTRAQGIDFKSGTLLLETGTRLDGVALALAAAAGDPDIAVRARPRVALLGTGDEIVPPGAAIGPHQIYDSVSFGLAGLLSTWGADSFRLAPRADDVDALAEAAREGWAKADLLITIGGASVGDRDLVKPALRALDMELIVERAQMRPGKPVWFGRTPHGLVLGLPGNPASALACAYVFGRAILNRMLGIDDAARFTRARLAADLPKNGPREHYLRAALSVDENGQQIVTPYERQDSSLLSVFRDANALIVLPASAPETKAGALVDVLPLGR